MHKSLRVFFPQLEDQLMIVKMIESSSTAVSSLVSLVQLLDKVKNMVIGDHIQSQVSNTRCDTPTHTYYCVLSPACIGTG